MVDIKVGGTVRLKEDYESPNKVRYYAVLDVYLEDQKYKENRPTSRIPEIPAPNLQVEVPITEYEYGNLKEGLRNSNDRSPVLRVRGNLEITIGGYGSS